VSATSSCRALRCAVLAAALIASACDPPAPPEAVVPEAPQSAPGPPAPTVAAEVVADAVAEGSGAAEADPAEVPAPEGSGAAEADPAEVPAPEDRGAAVARDAPTPEVVPAGNAPEHTEPPQQPGPGDVDERARHLFEAVVAGDPELAMDFFFPRGPFRLVKDSANPDRYYDRLLDAYRREILALHEALRDLERARFERFELGSRVRWMAVGSEYNRLPYWSARRSALHYSVDGEPRSFPVLVAITWDDAWYVVHLTDYLR
jgi:hypothetical protein